MNAKGWAGWLKQVGAGFFSLVFFFLFYLHSVLLCLHSGLDFKASSAFHRSLVTTSRLH
ncbi:hypothetical protein DL98DRAFT_247790 [Cadophora sp. DSE1049]|nr:hypothetical protein DL98DRAFT_247790 [Cadophora sp. DSE1049]